VRASGLAERAGLGPEDAREVPRHVPSHVVTALRRALAERPEDRWPDLDALLAVLRRDPAAARRRVMLGAAALGLTAVVTGVAVAATRDEPPPPCEDGRTRIDAVWNAERRAALAAVVGEAAWPAIDVRAQARASAWVDAHAQACRATEVDAVADDATLHRRMLCLESRRDELDAMLGALQGGSPTAAGNAATAIDLLPTSASCLDADAGAAAVPLPSDPARRVEIASAQRAVAEAQAAAIDPTVLDAAGKAERAVTLARDAGWGPVIADALNVSGAVAFEASRNEAAVAAYEQAVHLALSTGYDALAVRALTRLAWPLAELQRLDEAERVLLVGRALLERIGAPSYEERLVLGAEAHVLLRGNHPRDALAKTRAQIALSEQESALPATMAATNAYNLALALEQAGEYEAAMASVTQAIALTREALGDEHPRVALFQQQAAKIAAYRGSYGEAVELATRALELNERWYGPNDPHLTISLDVLAEAARRQGRAEEAMAHYRRHLALLLAHDPKSLHVPKLEANLAIATVEQGDVAGAAPMAARALASLERLYGPEAPVLVQALVLTGYIARERPEPDLAASARDLERALAIGRATLGPTHTETINAEIELANTRLAEGEAARVVEQLEAWLPRLGDLELPLHQPPELRFVLARALAARGQPARACALAEQAEADLRALEVHAEPMAQWRAQHCPS
jgi:tetratricopeptide (TPR) repeat protein